MDNQALHDELRDTFINYQYRLDRPMFVSQKISEEEAAINKYRTDSLFHSKVDALVGTVMYIVSNHY